jgi:imidazolonepropionase-like amidohydrolase
MGIKSELGYHPRSTTTWKGKRPSTCMGLVSLLRENLIKAKKTQNLLNECSKRRDEIDPVTEILMDVLNQKYKVMMHLHREDDVRFLI